jgi:hypothetical protein
MLQVVHHPTIMAAYCEGRKWTVMGDGELRSKFIGPSIQLKPVGVMHLSFHDGDEFTWHKVKFTFISQLPDCSTTTKIITEVNRKQYLLHTTTVYYKFNAGHDFHQ